MAFALRRTKWPREQITKLSIIKNAAEEEQDKARAALCKKSFVYFIKTFWECIASEELKWNWHIDYISNELMTVARRVAAGLPKEHDLVINVPPGTSKSSICTILFPVWCWINWSWMRFICSSYSGPLSLEHAEKSRDLVRHDKFQKLFPHITIKRDKDTKSNFRVQEALPNGVIQLGGNRYSTSVGGTVTGFHGHILLTDDPLNPQMAASEVELKTANKFQMETLSTRKVDKLVTVSILIQQRLAQNDPSGVLIDKNKKFKVKHICLPGEIRNYRKYLNPPELEVFYEDDLLDPVRMPWTVLNEMEEVLGQYGYAGQVGQNPVPPGGGMFQVDMLPVIEMLPEGVSFEKVRFWDNAATDERQKGAKAYSCGVKMYKYIKFDKPKYIIVDVKRGQWATDKREQIKRITAEADGKDVFIYNEQEPGSAGKDQARSTISNLDGYAVYAIPSTGKKEVRADPLSVQCNNGNVSMLKGDWNLEFKDEARFFPFSTTKDQIDAAASAYNILAGKKKVKLL